MFQAFREFGYPTLYPPLKSFYCDTFLITFLYFSGSLVFSFFIIIPGVRGKQRICTFLYGSLSLMTGMLIIICNRSYNWETASIVTRTPFKANSPKNVLCKIGVHIGLRGFNVTLDTLDSNVSVAKQVLSLNQGFRWTWQQGMQDPNSPLRGRLVRDLHRAQTRGSPLPIVWVAQHFAMDGESVRWGRHYRLAGYYTHILLWLALPLWLLGNILVYICIKYAGYIWISTGATLIGANCLYYLIRCPVPLHITFPDAVLTFGFGTSFWLTLYIGILSISIGTAIVVADSKCYEGLMAFFGIDVLQEYEDYIVDPVELGLNKMASPVSCMVRQSTKLVSPVTLESGLVNLPAPIQTDENEESVGKVGLHKNHNNNNSNASLERDVIYGQTVSAKDMMSATANTDSNNDIPGPSNSRVVLDPARNCYIVEDKMAFVSPSEQIPLLRKRGTSHSFLQKRKITPKKPHLIISKSVPISGGEKSTSKFSTYLRNSLTKSINLKKNVKTRPSVLHTSYL